MTRRMRSGVTPKGGTTLTEVALATREFSLVGKRVEAVRDGMLFSCGVIPHKKATGCLMQYNYRRREEAFCTVSSIGRAPPCHGGGKGIETPTVRQINAGIGKVKNSARVVK